MKRNRSLHIVLSIQFCIGTTICAGGTLTTYDSESNWHCVVSLRETANFDGFLGPVSSQYEGAMFGMLNGYSPNAVSSVGDGFQPPSISSPNIMLSSSGPGHGCGGWSVQFTPPVSGFGFWTGGLQFFGSTLEVFDAVGQIGAFDLREVSGFDELGWKFTGVVSTSDNIASLRVSINCVTGSGDYVGHDDFQFGFRGPLKGDVNGDGTVTTADIGPFISVLIGEDNQEPHVRAADLDCDGAACGRDIDPFVKLIVEP